MVVSSKFMGYGMNALGGATVQARLDNSDCTPICYSLASIGSRSSACCVVRSCKAMALFR